MRLLLGTSKRQIEHKDKEKGKTTREKELEDKGYCRYKVSMRQTRDARQGEKRDTKE